ncbi:MAG: hypothetical protein ACTHKK_09920 [Candidatus Nitrosocosmicus sp.]
MHVQILHIDISFERILLVAERFIVFLRNKHGKHPVTTDGGTWHPQACKFLKLNHYMYSAYEKKHYWKDHAIHKG